MTPETCGAVGERAQVILVWVRALGVKNASHLRRLGVMRVRHELCLAVRPNPPPLSVLVQVMGLRITCTFRDLEMD